MYGISIKDILDCYEEYTNHNSEMESDYNESLYSK